MKRRCFCLIGLVGFTILARAQTGTFQGRVVEAATGDPLPGVSVAVLGTKQGAITDVDGHFFIADVPPGRYTLQASFLGFEAQDKSADPARTDMTGSLLFRLVEDDDLPSIAVIYDTYCVFNGFDVYRSVIWASEAIENSAAR